MRMYVVSSVSRLLRFCLFRGSAVGRWMRVVIGVGSLLFITMHAIGWKWPEKNQVHSVTSVEMHSYSEGEDIEASLKPNDTWIKIRKVLLRRELQQDVSKVVLYSYMRGGSTLFSHIFNIDPQSTMLWYEALDAFHAHYSGLPVYSNTLRLLYNKNLTRRATDEEMILAMTDYLVELLTCDADRLPIESLTHRFITMSTALQGIAICMLDHFNRVFARRQQSLMLSFSMEYGDEFKRSPHLKVVSYMNLARFFRQTNLDDITRSDQQNVFRQYFDYVKDNELKTIVYRSCGLMLALPPPDLNFDTRNKVQFNGGINQNKPFDDNGKNINWDQQMYSRYQCQEIKNAFMSFLNVAVFMQSTDKESKQCRGDLKAVCKNKKLIVAEIHRASVLDLEHLIQRMPDVHLVFYVRDPRAIAVSRADPRTRQTYIQHQTLWSVVDESKLLCRRMWDDLEAKKRLERRYPGSILTVRYEDFLLDPRGTVTHMYGQFQRKVPEGFDRWVNETMNAGADNGLYGIQRSNGKQHISKWRSKVSFSTEQAMTQHCLNVLKELGYEF